MRYEGLVGGISGCWKTATEEVATTGTNAGDVEGTGTGSIRASCALAGNQLVRDLIRDSTVPSLSLAVNFPRVADRASTSIDFSHPLHKFLFNRQFQVFNKGEQNTFQYRFRGEPVHPIALVH
jgi:hypothetical protein